MISLRDDLAPRRGVFVAGEGSGRGEALDELARAIGWPVIASPQAPVWAVAGAAVPAVDAILRTDVASELVPEVIVRLGATVASRVAGEWLAATGAPEIVVAGDGRWVDPHGTATVVLATDPAEQLAAWMREVGDAQPIDGGAWRAAWAEAGESASEAISDVLRGEPTLNEPAIARAVTGALPEGAALVLSSSMPIRDVEWFVEPGRPVVVHANRGANGIDGVVSAAVGVALGSGAPTALLIGDVAFLHDSNGLLGIRERALDLLLVIVDNDGGGIFSFLPQATNPAVPADRFESLFGTPHGLDIASLVRAYGVPAESVDTAEGLVTAVQGLGSGGGVRAVVVKTDRAENVEVHRRLNAAVADALAR